MKEIEKALVTLFILLTFSQMSFTQPGPRSCGTEVWVDEKLDEEPQLELYFNKSFRTFYQDRTERSLPVPECPLVIPVHVIIIHPPGQAVGEGDNLSLEHIQSQIDVINEDFGRYNADAANTPAQFSAESTGIQFCLASVDPDGNPTDGVSRYATNEIFDFGIEGDEYNTRINIKNITGWDRNRFLNIWVAPTIGRDSDIIGFSRVPSLSSHPDPQDDGLSILTSVFGGPGYGQLAPYNLGRTTTHELGHYLGLLHIATRNNTCTGDDGIADTPVQFKQNHGCPTHPTISCGNNGDMFMNFMDYTDDACMNAFTADQGEYMRTLLFTLRRGLLEQAAISCTELVTIEVEIEDIRHASCYEGNDGYVSFNACGGNNENYSFSIDGGNFILGNSFSGVEPGIHTVTVRNNLGVSNEITFEIMSPPQMIISIDERKDISCFGANDGMFSISITGGSVADDSDYSISINNGPFTGTLSYSTLPPGTFDVHAMDDNGCSAYSSLTLASPSPVSLSSISIDHVLCYGENTASITVEGSGGTPGYTYSSDGILYDVDPVFSGISAGSAELWVKDFNNCVTSEVFNVTQPEPLEISGELVQKISCAGNNDAIVNIIASGGVGSYRYFLDDFMQPSSVISTLSAGTVDLAVEDSNGCFMSVPFIIEDPAPLVLDSILTTDVLCAGDKTGSIEVVAKGGTAPYSFYLDGIPDDDGIFENLSENLYEVTVHDAHLCEIISESVIITNGNLKVATLEKTIPTCSYSMDGSLRVTASGGVGTYSYSIDGINFQENDAFEGLASGIYIVRVSDGEECLASTVVDLRAPKPVELTSLNVIEPSCFGTNDGVIDFKVKGGSGIYEFKLNGNDIENSLITDLKAGDYILEVTDSKGCRFETLIPLPGHEEIRINLNSITPADCSVDVLGTLNVTATGGDGIFLYELHELSNNEGIFNDLFGGNYMLTVTDESGCSTNMEIEIPSVGGLVVTLAEMKNESCPGAGDGAFQLATTGGSGPYTYYFNDSSYTDGSFTDLDPGVYEVFISDNAACGENFMVKILPGLPVALDQVGGTPPSCFNSKDGTLRLKASGGNGTLLYHHGNRENRTGIFPGVAAGNYTVSITDGNNCQTLFDITFEGPSQIFVDTLNIISPSCNDESNGSVYLHAAGGTGLKTITFKGNSYSSEVSLENISAGNYRFDLKDEKGCSERIDVFVDDPSPLQITDILIAPQTIENKGNIELILKGGSKPYTYSIDGKTDQSSPSFSDLEEGSYEIIVTDRKGCYLTVTVDVPYNDDFENPPGSISDVLLGFERIRNETILSFIAHGDQKIKLYIFNAEGRFVMRTEEFSIDGPNRMTIPARDFPPGIYFVRIEAERESEFYKFIKL